MFSQIHNRIYKRRISADRKCERFEAKWALKCAVALGGGGTGRAHRVAASVKSGIIWVNCWLFRDLRTPFGGMKQSGVGREGGFEALKFFTEEKNVCIKL